MKKIKEKNSRKINLYQKRKIAPELSHSSRLGGGSCG